ncbi:MAG: choice-of-anchor M domain-containing protein, partial [Verrucomicrobiaceae bacterium]|nr:choice-of-anchor M domain-containing protein [Verrucomicrobiaceae bacterium]
MKRLFAILLLAAAPAIAQVTDIMSGHFETHVDYDGGFEFYTSYNPTGDFNNSSADVRLNAASTRFVASPACQTTLPASMSEIGTPGSTVWIMPQIPVVGAPYLGIRAIFQEGDFYDYFMGNYFLFGSGSVRYQVTNVTGTGPSAGGYFGMFVDSLGESGFLVNTHPTSPAPDEVQALTANAHEHFSWVFTKPGTYDVTVRAEGKLIADDSIQSGTGVYHFSVPFSSRLSGSGTIARLGFEASNNAWHILLEDPANAVAYRSNQGFLEVPGTAPRQLAVTFSALGSGVANIVGQTPALAAAGIPNAALQSNSATLRLVSVTGPGHFSLLNSTGTVTLMNSADGITSGDSISVTRAANLSTLAAFTANGLYRVAFQLSGTTSGGAPVSSQPITLSFGVGLTADHSYAQWADSYERTRGLSAGTLTSQTADFDNDGIANGLEFQLFWHGCDPTVADAGVLPLPAVPGGMLVADFLRDTSKDHQNGTTAQISAQLSTDLTTWTTRT